MSDRVLGQLTFPSLPLIFLYYDHHYHVFPINFCFAKKDIYIVGRYIFRLICTVLIWSQKIDCLLLFYSLQNHFFVSQTAKEMPLLFCCARLKKRKLQSKEPLTVLASPSFVCLDRHSVFSISCKKTDMKFKVQKKISGSETDHSLVLLSTHF